VNVFTGSVMMVEMTCPTCGVAYALSEVYRNTRKQDHKNWRCPNGHTLWFPEESDEEKLRRRLKMERAANERLRMERDASERSRAAIKGHLTRARNRIAKGVCPVPSCKRHFANVENHMRTEHPDYIEKHPEVLSGGSQGRVE
jgi:hypothetical protein